MRKKTITIITVVSVLCLAGFAFGIGATDLKPAPDLKLTDLDGKTFKLSDHQGKVVILNFWAVWCPPCRIEIPHLVALYNKYKNQGLVVLGIAISSGSDKKIKAKANEWGISYPLINGDNSPAIRRNFPEVRAIPNSFIINQEGKFFKNYVGFAPNTPIDLEQDIKTLLKQ